MVEEGGLPREYFEQHRKISVWAAEKTKKRLQQWTYFEFVTRKRLARVRVSRECR
jgi:hypothetical protein